MSETVVSLSDIEKIAHSVLPKNALGYYSSGADLMQTLNDNREAFKRYRILPKMLVDVSKRNLSTDILNGQHRVKMPIGIAPTAMQRMAHPDGEVASARAAQAAGTVFIMSTLATCSIEEVAAAAPKAIKWFQLYIYNDREVTKNLIRRAEEAGFSALVLTVDAPFFGRRIADIKNKFSLPPHLTLANFADVSGDFANKVGQKGEGSAINAYVASLFDQTLSWKDVQWLNSITKLPILLKGVLRPDDAIKGVKAGAAGIIVSNHGARQIDGVPATIDVLKSIKLAVGKDVEVYLDGGVTMGTDVLKALSLGAKMVFIGRPVLWGLAWRGQKGVEITLEILKDELDRSLALSGCRDVNTIPLDIISKSQSML